MPFFMPEQRDILERYFRREENLPEARRYLTESLEAFIAKEVAPRAYRNDEDEVFAEDTFKKLGELGYYALNFPEEYGGLGLNPAYHVAGLESLAKGDAGFTLGVAIHGTMADGICRFASKAIKDRVLSDLVAGRKIGAFALTEADHGSDAKAMRTSYQVDEKSGDFLIRGQKFWITNAPSADYFFLMARNAAKPEQISSFLVEKPNQGTFRVQPISDKMGVRGSNTGELIFENHRIPKANLIGQEGDGFKYAMHMLNGGRVTIGAWATGVAQGAYEKFLAYAHERKLFGKLLKDLDNTGREVAEMAIALRSARELAYAAAYDKGIGHPNFPAHAAMAKVAGTEASFHVCERVIELSGGFGYLRESKLERHLRDAILGRIGEGANELLKVVVIPRYVYQHFESLPKPPNW